MASDRLVLKNMVFYGYHGAFAAEKELGQRFEVDVELHLDFKSAAAADDLELSVNCGSLYLVKEIVEEREFNLLETLAETIGEISPPAWKRWSSGSETFPAKRWYLDWSGISRKPLAALVNPN